MFKQSFSMILVLLALTQSAFAAERMNVLFIAVDDLRPELGCYGASTKTPHIDRLAASGLRFNRAYCNQAVCGASRTSLMTGLYPEFTDLRSYHVRGWRKKWSKVVTLNQHFKANGYHVAGLGKIYHSRSGPEADEPNWDRWVEINQDHWLTAEAQEMVKQQNQQPKGRRGPATESADVENEAYLDGKRAARAVELIAEAKDQGPFFVAVGFTKPHLPFNAPKRYWDLYDRDQFGLPDNLGVPPGYPAGAANVRPGELFNYGDIPLGKMPADFSTELNQRLIHGYHACVSYLDANVGRLLDALDQHGLAENTIVVLWGDHGWKLGDHTSWCKHTNFEVDTRVPLIIRHPNKAQGVTDSLVELIDLYPTLCELAGLSIPAHVQGRSQLAVLDDPTANVRKTAYSSYPASVEGGRTVGHSIRTSTHRYTEWWKGSDKVQAVATNLRENPGETTAVNDPELLEDLSKMVRDRVMDARQLPEDAPELR